MISVEMKNKVEIEIEIEIVPKVSQLLMRKLVFLPVYVIDGGATPTQSTVTSVKNIIQTRMAGSIGFPGQFQTICNQFDISSNQFRPKCDRGKKSAFKFVFERSKSKTQQSNCKLRQSI